MTAIELDSRVLRSIKYSEKRIYLFEIDCSGITGYQVLTITSCEQFPSFDTWTSSSKEEAEDEFKKEIKNNFYNGYRVVSKKVPEVKNQQLIRNIDI